MEIFKSVQHSKRQLELPIYRAIYIISLPFHVPRSSNIYCYEQTHCPARFLSRQADVSCVDVLRTFLSRARRILVLQTYHVKQSSSRSYFQRTSDYDDICSLLDYFFFFFTLSKTRSRFAANWWIFKLTDCANWMTDIWIDTHWPSRDIHTHCQRNI